MGDTNEKLSKTVIHAQNELSSVVKALTAVLMAVADTKPAANGQPSEASRVHSLSEVLKRVDALKDAVDEATRAGESRIRAVIEEEDSVLSAEREALVRRRDKLMNEVKHKNGKVKLLIDDLRELHRDIAVLLSVFNSMKVQQRVR